VRPLVIGPLTASFTADQKVSGAFRSPPDDVALCAAMTDTWTFRWLTGPDAGGASTLPTGEHVVGGSASASIRCDDPDLEPHHLLVEVGDGVTVQQLAGRVPVRVNGEPVSGAVRLEGSASIEVGASLLLLAAGDLTGPGQTAGEANIVTGASGRVLVRRPRAAPRWEPAPIEPLSDQPGAGETSGGLLPALLALAAAVVLAVLTRQPMFLLFGGIGAVVAIGTWGGQKVGLLRLRRRTARSRINDGVRFQRELAAQRAAFVAHRTAHDSTASTAHHVIEGLTHDLWSRRRQHADAFHVGLGLGPLAWTPEIHDRPGVHRSSGGLTAESVLPDLAVLADLGAGARVAVRGSLARTLAVARAILVQLAANCGPADVRFVVVTHEPARWRWLHRLPHCASAAGSASVVAETELADTVAALDAIGRGHLLVVTDTADLLSARTSPLRRIVNNDPTAAVLVLVDAEAGVPHVCTSLLDVGRNAHARWLADAALTSLPVPVRWAGIGENAAAALTRRLDGLIDPEDPMHATGGIPQSVSLAELLPLADASTIAAAWLAHGTDPPPRAMIGVAADGVVDVDLVRDGPHALIAGTTGSGKSELLRSLVAGLAAGCSPEHLTFVLIDYKGGATFDACADLPHVVGTVTDLDAHLADRALRSLHAELRRREALLRAVGAADLAAYRQSATEPLPRLVVVIDEFATLVAEQPQFLHALVGIAQRGRSLGVHLILATQRPNGVISDDVRANTNLRIALRLQDAMEAVDVVGDAGPAAIARGLPGRAVMRLGPEEVLTFQTAHCTATDGEGATVLRRLVDAVSAAAALVGASTPLAPWLPPLPGSVSVADVELPAGTVGVVDDPDRQRRLPLCWSPNDGHLLLVGSKGSGVTSTLVLLGSVAARQGSHVYAIDGRGDALLDRLGETAACGGVVRVHERERLIRLIGRLGAELTRRAAGTAAGSQPLVLLVDGFDLVRSSLDEFETASEHETLETLMAIGASHGIAVVAAFDRVAAIPSAILARSSRRWVFHLTDALDAAGLGLGGGTVPGVVPGRMFDTASGLEAQLAHGVVPLSSVVAAGRPAPVTALASMIDASALPSGQRTDHRALLPIGLRFDNDEPCSLHVPDGEHVLVLGPARSGRSTALRRMVDAWRGAHPDGWWCVITPRRSVFGAEHRSHSLREVIDEIPTDGAVLIAVDDAELVDDIDGRLAAWAGCRRPDLLIAAAGKPDSLRHSYGHWTAVVRRSRLGLISTSATDLDGDLLAATLPRKLPIHSRPGLMWVVADGALTLVQVAVPSVSRHPGGRETLDWVVAGPGL
jgi:DNA segregation ATPase FtsK/SpoIIIE, S-DNA-T family